MTQCQIAAAAHVSLLAVCLLLHALHLDRMRCTMQPEQEVAASWVLSCWRMPNKQWQGFLSSMSSII